MKNLLAIGITGTLLYLGFKAFGLNRFNVYSVVRTLNPRITKVTLTGLSLATEGSSSYKMQPNFENLAQVDIYNIHGQLIKSCISGS